MDRTFASVDLGSNSFHLLIVDEQDGHLHVVDKIKERVLLAAGLTAERTLTAKAQRRALDCLEQFGHRLARVPPENVRAVGTNTLRKASDGMAFIARAQDALGHRIEIISGAEEARLVYLGVAHDLADDGERRLVVDIGGGSTECIVGEGQNILRADSLYMGCVEYTRRFFIDDKLIGEHFDQATVASRLELGSLHRAYKRLGWRHAYGSSGTINAVQDVLTANGKADHCITLEGLDWLIGAMRRARKISRLSLNGLPRDRANVFPGGVAILRGVFRSLRLERMVASGSALREGVILDLIGRAVHADVRETTVQRMAERYGADAEQAGRVETLALALFEQAAGPWGLDPEEGARMLRWAARLHEIGKAISYAGYHRHGSYLIANSDMPGFSRGEQALLAAMVLGVRRKLDIGRIRELAGLRTALAIRLTVLLRLAARLNRTRSPNPRPDIKLAVKGDQIHVTFPPTWLRERPLTRADLEGEADRFASAGLSLTWGVSSRAR